MRLDETRLSDRYRLESEIATGGMAAVWLATDEVLERKVAAKILHAHLAMDETFRARFRNEALSAAALTHPSIVAVYDTGDHQGIPFIVMELLPGGTLRDLIAKGHLEPSRVAEIGAAVARALDYAHAHGVIHRDIKPANILFSESGLLKVSDFGIAKAAFAETDLTTTGVVLGTIHYLAPEQVEGEEPDGRSDVYSLGLVLYEAVTGRRPFTGETDLATAMARLKATPPPPRDVRPEVPKELDRIIMKSLAPNREERYSDAASLARDLDFLRERSGFSDFDPGVIDHAPPTEALKAGTPSFVRSEGRLFLTIFLVLLVGAALVFGVIWLRESREGFENLLDRVLSRDGTSVDGERIDFTAGIYDPESKDKTENNNQAPLVHDSDRDTAWYTDCYSRENLGGLKKGVGIFFDLGKPLTLDALEVVSVADAWSGTIRYSEDGRLWSDPDRPQTVSSREFTFDLDGAEHRFVQIWITRLVRMDERCARSRAGEWAVGIAELIPR